MAKHLNAFGLSFRVVLFFGRNPEEELTTVDIAEKFEVDAEDVRAMLRRPLGDGLLRQLRRGGGPGNPSAYAAGPLLLQMVGVAMEACSPTPGGQMMVGRR